MALYALEQDVPQAGPGVWVADSAAVIGRVTLLDNVSIWYGAVLRGDEEPIVVGRDSNIQDNSTLHTDAGFPLTVGERVTVGHQVVLHGCTIGEGTLVGIGAVVLSGARIGRHCLVAAGALVTEGAEFGDNLLIMGTPAKAVREVSPQLRARLENGSRHYVEFAARHRQGLRRID